MSAAHISYPDLPISAHVTEIADLIASHQVVIVAGETGSGKTTQLPKICLQAGRKHIGHTQPRRIAARSLATRIAEEMRVPLGDYVGYQVRFTQQTSKATRVKVMTDGILLAEITHDRLLKRYDTIIIDEAHERSLTIDFLLGYLKQLLPQRPDLKVIITSATIDTARFSEHFSDAPIVEVSGRTYPVEVRYRPLSDDNDTLDQADGIALAVEELCEEGPGDILVFCSGEREIRDALKALEGCDAEVLPLHSRLSAAEQQCIFQTGARRRVIVATNIAETSVTVPGVRYVVDAGTARISRYSARTKVQRLPIEPISQASANQRAGRCGRLGPGICIRLYSEEDYAGRPEFTEPEILRTNLASVILAMAKARLGDIEAFPFVEAPDAAQIHDGMNLLRELGAIRDGKPVRLTRTGHRLAEIPVDPRLGRMLIEADKRGCLADMLVLASFLAIQDIRERPAERRDEADQAHARFFSDVGLAQALGENAGLAGLADLVLADQAGSGGARQGTGANGAGSAGPTGSAGGASQPLRHTAHTSGRARHEAMLAKKRKGKRGAHAGQGAAQGAAQGAQASGPRDATGDLGAILRMWTYLKAQRKALSGNGLRRMCREEYLNYLRYREWQDLHTQLRSIVRDLGMGKPTHGSEQDIIISVLAGVITHIGLQIPPTQAKGRRPLTEYRGTRGTKFAIQPGSALSKHQPPVLMAVELVETSRLWARTVAEIDPTWLEELAPHLLTSTYSEPHWSSNSATVTAYQRISLLGVPIIADRPINYARINPAEARTIFIQSGLVEGGWTPVNRRVNHDFLTHNRQIVEQAEDIFDRTRAQEFIVDDRVIAEFYDARIPADVTSGATFDAWWRTVTDRSMLEFDMTLFADRDQVRQAHHDFPSQWTFGEHDYALDYVFDPGASRDGVTLTVPLAQLNQVNADQLSWQVPGLREQLAAELIRSLPKSLRTNFVPAPNWATRALEWLEANNVDYSRPITAELARALRALTGVEIPEQAWAPESVPAHLRLGFTVIDDDGSRRHGSDLKALQRELADQISQTITHAAPADQATHSSWAWETIDTHTTIQHGSITAQGYPALSDEGHGVKLIMADTPRRAAQIHRDGIRRLLVCVNPDPTKWCVAHLSNTEKLALPSAPYASVPALFADARLATADSLAVRHGGTDVRTRADFERLATAVRQDQADRMHQIVSLAAQVAISSQKLHGLLDHLPALRTEITEHHDDLVFDGYLSATRGPWLDRVPYWVEAMIQRCELAAQDHARDERLMAPIDEIRQDYTALCDRLPPGPLPPEVEDIALWIEELYVQTFAQRLGTRASISPKRIRTMIKNLPAEIF